MRLTAIESFRGFAQAASETIVNKGKFEDACGDYIMSDCAFGPRLKPRGEYQRVQNGLKVDSCSTVSSNSVPFRASRTDMFPEEPEASAGTSTSSAGATGEVGSSPSDC
jgi:hypothetical protein